VTGEEHVVWTNGLGIRFLHFQGSTDFGCSLRSLLVKSFNYGDDIPKESQARRRFTARAGGVTTIARTATGLMATPRWYARLACR